MEVFICLTEENVFHTLIIQAKVSNQMFVAALGYAGGRTYAEFFGKFEIHKVKGITGLYSYSNGSGEWEHKIQSSKFDSRNNTLKLYQKEVYQLMDEKDTKLQNKILSKMSEYIYWGYDQESNQEYENPILKDSCLIKLNQIFNTNQYRSDGWSYDYMKITQSQIWPLFFSF